MGGFFGVGDDYFGFFVGGLFGKVEYFLGYLVGGNDLFVVDYFELIEDGIFFFDGWLIGGVFYYNGNFIYVCFFFLNCF